LLCCPLIGRLCEGNACSVVFWLVGYVKVKLVVLSFDWSVM